MATIKIEMTPDQAAAMTRQLDLATRISLCQFREIEYMARMGELKHQAGRRLTMDECGEVDYVLKSLSTIFGFPPNASFGIGSEHVSHDAHRGYEIMKVVQKALAVHRDPNPHGMRGVDYDGLLVRYTTDQAPVAIISLEDEVK